MKKKSKEIFTEKMLDKEIFTQNMKKSKKIFIEKIFSKEIFIQNMKKKNREMFV